MNIGIIVFAYNRNRHLEKVLRGLKENEGITKLYIFQDGLKAKEHQREWDSTRRLIEGIDWCKVEYNLSSYNKGLAKSIIDGINAVFKENDAVIVLEDDCVPMPNFIAFMKQCFEKYKDDKRVYSVAGYAWPIDVPQDGYDVYGCGRTSSWGWGTWSDRWEKYVQDYEIIRRINRDKAKSINLALWGRDLENMLVARLRGLNDSWAVFWSLNVIETGGICVFPYKSLIRNIGMDGSGVHCGISDKYDVQLDESKKRVFRLPDKIMINSGTKNAYAALHGSYTACETEKAYTKEPLIVYGVGRCFFSHEKEICDKYHIIAFMDGNKKGWFAGKEVISFKEVNAEGYINAKVLITIQDYGESKKVEKLLLEKGHITYNRIVMVQDLFIE